MLFAGHHYTVIVVIGLLFATRSVATDGCEDAATSRGLDAALAEIEASVDPCGETEQLTDVVRKFRRCAAAGYRLCLNREIARNFTDPSPAVGMPTTITWNPELRTELERGCGDDIDAPVLRDPLASLLHEVVHAVQDCDGFDPTEHEFDAIRYENIYRRARGLCQRTRYGRQPLPAAMIVDCDRRSPLQLLQTRDEQRHRSGS